VRPWFSIWSALNSSARSGGSGEEAAGADPRKSAHQVARSVCIKCIAKRGRPVKNEMDENAQNVRLPDPHFGRGPEDHGLKSPSSLSVMQRSVQ
jgi:hypothetical protein